MGFILKGFAGQAAKSTHFTFKQLRSRYKTYLGQNLSIVRESAPQLKLIPWPSGGAAAAAAAGAGLTH